MFLDRARVLVIGTPDAECSSLCNVKFWGGPIVDRGLYEEFFHVCTIDGHKMEIQIDEAPCFVDERFEAVAGRLTEIAMTSAHGFVLMFAVEPRDSLDKMKEIYEEIVRRRGTDDIPIVIFGNRIAARDITSEEGREFAESIGAKYFEYSTFNRDNTDEMFDELARTVQEWYRRHPEAHKKAESPGELSRKKKKKSVLKCSVA